MLSLLYYMQARYNCDAGGKMLRVTGAIRTRFGSSNLHRRFVRELENISTLARTLNPKSTEKAGFTAGADSFCYPGLLLVYSRGNLRDLPARCGVCAIGRHGQPISFVILVLCYYLLNEVDKVYSN